MEASQILDRDYPPSIQIFVQNAPSESSFDLPEVQVIGLDIECSLPVLSKEISMSQDKYSPCTTAQPLHTPTLQQPMSMEVKGATVTTDGGELKVAVSSTLSKSILAQYNHFFIAAPQTHHQFRLHHHLGQSHWLHHLMLGLVKNSSLNLFNGNVCSRTLHVELLSSMLNSPIQVT